MNACSNNGYLVDGEREVPTDPTDFHVEALPAVGCNRLRCRGCGADVRHVAGFGFRTPAPVTAAQLEELYATADLKASPWLEDIRRPVRLYLCNCSRWLEDDVHVCRDPNPDDTDPKMPWGCTGHPTIPLPHDIHGVLVTSHDDLRDLTFRGLRGFDPPHARPEDKPHAAWLCRLPARLLPADAAVVIDAALEALDADEAVARARALELFTVVPSDAARARVLAILGGDRKGYAGVKSPGTRFSGDVTLEHTAWRVVGPLVEAGGSARDLARRDALAGNGARALYLSLARSDGEWLVSKLDEIARAAGGAHLQDLQFALPFLPRSFPLSALRERASRAAAGEP